MFTLCTTRGNNFGYLIWSLLLRKSGSTSAFLDGFHLSPHEGMNDYEALARAYLQSDVKPDKQFSILPTVMDLVGDCVGKTAIDLGCGSGFFTLAIAQAGASVVCGVDNSCAQILLAREYSNHPAIHYCEGDIFTQHGGPVDVITAPFVANYSRTKKILAHFFKMVYTSLKEGGKAVFVIDLPNGKNLERFGAQKTFTGQAVDESRIQIRLYNRTNRICTLFAVYYTPRTIEELLKEAGFRSVEWHRPIISDEGVAQMGAEFWDGYLDDPELGYVVACK